jgi:hypothetical protein
MLVQRNSKDSDLLFLNVEAKQTLHLRCPCWHGASLFMLSGKIASALNGTKKTL